MELSKCTKLFGLPKVKVLVIRPVIVGVLRPRGGC